MGLVNELESLVSYLERAFPDKQFERQNVPATPKANTIYVRVGRTNSTLSTNAAVLNSRLWEIIYCGDSTLDVLDVIDRMKQFIANDGNTIPLLDSTHYMRVRYFNFSEPFFNENNQSMVIGNFRGDTRTLREFPEVGTIKKASVNRSDDPEQ